MAAQYLGRFRKKLPEELLDELVAAPPTANPLYLKVLLDELWGASGTTAYYRARGCKGDPG